jgi:hypothetical protein
VIEATRCDAPLLYTPMYLDAILRLSIEVAPRPERGSRVRANESQARPLVGCAGARPREPAVAGLRPRAMPTGTPLAKRCHRLYNMLPLLQVAPYQYHRAPVLGDTAQKLAVRAASDPVAADDCLEPLVESRFPQQAA